MMRLTLDAVVRENLEVLGEAAKQILRRFRAAPFAGSLAAELLVSGLCSGPLPTLAWKTEHHLGRFCFPRACQPFAAQVGPRWLRAEL